jgi:hypothetical protein
MSIMVTERLGQPAIRQKVTSPRRQSVDQGKRSNDAPRGDGIHNDLDTTLVHLTNKQIKE